MSVNRANMPWKRFRRKCIIISKNTPLRIEVDSTEAQSMAFPHCSLTCLGQFQLPIEFFGSSWGDWELQPQGRAIGGQRNGFKMRQTSTSIVPRGIFGKSVGGKGK